ncbi:MAG: ComF family protein [Gemmatimonadaceae bacterium]
MVRLLARSRPDAPSGRERNSGARARVGLTLAAIAGGAVRAALALCFPRICAACERALAERDKDAVCSVCLTRLAPLGAPRCERCGHPGIVTTCGWCHALDERVLAARSVCWMTGGTGGALVHALKYGGWRVVARPMAERMARLDSLMQRRARTALLPVPLARARERDRGFNQSELLATELSRFWSVPVWSSALQRTRNTPTQTALTPQQRLTNVAGAFTIMSAYRARVRGAHLILVDDVITTGATMNACTTAMFAAGARSVAYVTFGRARGPGDPAT